ncbi:MAG: hypothetical protein AW07_04647 [Candidatus Accumulibacter sp. SK-11]|nr:MAG: hypothetical protein AW07_04647 [Candidatus Accumulibacter sp. SK-11]
MKLMTIAVSTSACGTGFAATASCCAPAATNGGIWLSRRPLEKTSRLMPLPTSARPIRQRSRSRDSAR